ncbi:uncharacterized protein LOC116349524 [Contarinia nasturtii]|uniref:uncharacterized protein LOC116349524 n=1 Tax=Contarinia nasturtii TaxID=265458 RepID=UPI0012D486CC|nr:uncharacterized protein LOC116349524 [Contarinia nasturtii]
MLFGQFFTSSRSKMSQNLNMKTIVILFVLLNSLVDCKPIEHTTKSSSLLNAAEVNHSGKSGINIQTRNAARMSLPNDVEWIQPTTVSNQQQVLPNMTSAVGSLFELILAIPIGVLQSVGNLLRSATTPRRF